MFIPERRLRQRKYLKRLTSVDYFVKPRASTPSTLLPLKKKTNYAQVVKTYRSPFPLARIGRLTLSAYRITRTLANFAPVARPVSARLGPVRSVPVSQSIRWQSRSRVEWSSQSSVSRESRRRWPWGRVCACVLNTSSDALAFLPSATACSPGARQPSPSPSPSSPSPQHVVRREGHAMSSDEPFHSLFTATDSIDGIWPFLQSVSLSPFRPRSRVSSFSFFPSLSPV